MYDHRAETMSRDERAALQSDRLRALVDRLLSLGGVQGGRLREAGVESGADVDLDDLPKLPMTNKQDLWDHYPLGMLAVSLDDVVAVHGSSGTGGRPTLVGYTRADLDLWAAMCARSLGCAGATPSSVVHNAYGYGLFTGGLGIHQGAVKLGAAVVPMSGGMTPRQVRMLVDLQPDILTCTPSYAVRLGEALYETGVDPDQLNLAAGVFGAEPWSEALRTKIEALLPLGALDIYGLSEVIGPGVATECMEAQQGLHVNEDHFLVEAVDPLSGEPVPEGTSGELVFTTPTKEALPLLRYRSGDIAALSSGECRCGRTLVRMSKVLGRYDDMLVVRGVNIYPSEVERVLLADGRVASHYQLVVDRRADASRLLVACEPLGGEPASEPAGGPVGGLPGGLAGELQHALRQELGLTAEVRVLPVGSVPRVEMGKAVRVVNWAEGDPPPVPGLT
ncbi:MAG: AMP-binding protein [Streptosporangiales bacterium]|nr:AMP-binding protein [Streptosporangiales bacterium]